MNLYCDRHPTARATHADAVYGLKFCGHCATKHADKLVLVAINVEAEVVAK